MNNYMNSFIKTLGLCLLACLLCCCKGKTNNGGGLSSTVNGQRSMVNGQKSKSTVNGQQQPLQIFPFRVEDADWVAGGVLQVADHADTLAGEGGGGEG